MVSKIHEAAYTINRQYHEDAVVDVFNAMYDLNQMLSGQR